jgi:SIR2-like domain
MSISSPQRVDDDPSGIEGHYDSVVSGLMRGRVTPVLGAGVNLCASDPDDHDWEGKHPPGGQELADHLAARFKYPPDRPRDLLHVSQYVYAMRGGSGPLYDCLHEVFDHQYPTTPVHDFIASVPGALRGRMPVPRSPLVVTTNYDDLMENAFIARGEPFDLIVYSAEGPYQGLLCERRRDGTMRPILDPKTNVELDPDRRPVILKIHGFVDRVSTSAANDDSYVITEDHYIEYLGRMDLETIPVKVLERLRNCHFWFLGAGLSDWNLRASLYRLWSERRRDWDWWAIQMNPDELERKSWRRRGVEIFDVPLDAYIDGLARRFTDALGLR